MQNMIFISTSRMFLFKIIICILAAIDLITAVFLGKKSFNLGNELTNMYHCTVLYNIFLMELEDIITEADRS